MTDADTTTEAAAESTVDTPPTDTLAETAPVEDTTTPADAPEAAEAATATADATPATDKAADKAADKATATAADEAAPVAEPVAAGSVAAVAIPTGGGFHFGHLLKAEYLKIRTTNVWWLLALFTVLATGLALTVNILTFHFSAGSTPTDGSEPFNQVNGAAGIYTSGQFFGALLALILAILTITNEYHHQTVTTTFLATPHRSAVIMAKFVVSMIAAALFWVLTTVLDLITGAIYFSADGYPNRVGNHTVVQAILLSLLVFALWAVFGVGLGVLIRSQIGATVTAAMLYTVGLYLAIGIFGLIHAYLIKHDWVLSSMVIVPAIAAQVAISPTKIFPQSPAQWVGVAVMVGYAIVFGGIGIYYTRRRDIS